MATPVAGELYESITGQLFEIGRQLRQPSGYPFNPDQLKTALQDAIEGNFGGARRQSLLSIITSTSLGAVAGKPTKKCFAGSYYVYRDGNFDRWLPVDQPQATPCEITTLASAKDAIFVRWASTILGISASTPTKTLGSLLIERGHTMTLVQVENMVGRTENGEATGMRTDGYANFFFVETSNEDDPVSVADVLRDGSRWGANVDRLGRGGRWRVGFRLLVRNLDASRLGL